MKADHQDHPATGRDYTDEELRSFVHDLESLRSGELTVSLLVGCGVRAIAPLRDYLLHGQPRGIFQPRQHAVEALAQLGAKDALLEYLSQKRNILDAVARFGEEAVENTAARALSQWPTDDVYLFLRGFAEKRVLSGAVEALGKFERVESGELLLRALEDDVCRPTAEDALRLIARQVKPLLLRAAHRNRREAEETPSQRQRRLCVLKILSEMHLSKLDWEELRPLLQDEDARIALTTAQIAIDTAAPEEKREAARFLIHSYREAHWYSQMQVQDCFRRNYASVRDVIAEEVSLRRRLMPSEAPFDPVLRILVHLQSTEGKPFEGSERHGTRNDST